MNTEALTLANASYPFSRRRFLGLVTAAVGAVYFSTSRRALGQDPTDRAAIDESLRGRLIFWSSTRWDPEHAGVFSYDLVTRKYQSVLDGVDPEWFCRTSPDGKSFALAEGQPPHSRMSLIGSKGRAKVSDLRSRAFWSRDGQQVVLSEWETGRKLTAKTWWMNADGTGRVRLGVPDNELVLDWSRDGRWFLIARRGEDRLRHSALIRRGDGTDPRPLQDDVPLEFWPGRFSPDGRRVAYTRVSQDVNESSLWEIDVETRADRLILRGDVDGYPEGTPCWSPDGKYLALEMADRTNGYKNREVRVEIVDLRGRRIRELGLPHKYPDACNWL